MSSDARATFARQVQPGLSPLPNVKNIIAIASGKGGVGKSTTAANLALALSARGFRVGLLDADIYGPSQPHMLGATAKPESVDNQLVPVMCHGLQTMSIGYLVEDDAAVIWRGPMATRCLQQMLFETRWDALDFLLIDLPPGTGDIQLTLVQKIPLSGAVVVTTPQDIALLDVTRAIQMFAKVNVAVLGVVENMSTHVCTACGHEDAIFGEGGAAYLAEKFSVELLGQLPLDRHIREQTDAGVPTVVADPTSLITEKYCAIADKLVAGLAARPKSYAHKFPKITVE